MFMLQSNDLTILERVLWEKVLRHSGETVRAWREHPVVNLMVSSNGVLLLVCAHI